MDSSAFQTSCDIGRLAFPKYQTANHVVAYLTSQLYTPSVYRADRKRLVTRFPRFHVLTQWSTIRVVVTQKRERETVYYLKTLSLQKAFIELVDFQMHYLIR